jgi:hypothetical protein
MSEHDDKYPHKEMGDRLRLMMKAHGIRSVDVQERLDLKSGKWANWVLGKHRVPDDIVRQLRALYGISSDWLLWGDESNITNHFAKLLAKAGPLEAEEPQHEHSEH